MLGFPPPPPPLSTLVGQAILMGMQLQPMSACSLGRGAGRVDVVVVLWCFFFGGGNEGSRGNSKA